VDALGAIAVVVADQDLHVAGRDETQRVRVTILGLGHH